MLGSGEGVPVSIVGCWTGWGGESKDGCAGLNLHIHGDNSFICYKNQKRGERDWGPSLEGAMEDGFEL